MTNAAEFRVEFPTYAQPPAPRGLLPPVFRAKCTRRPDQMHGFEERFDADIFPLILAGPRTYRKAGRSGFEWWYHNMGSRDGAGCGRDHQSKLEIR